ncbi:MAG: ABC transporter permease [Cyclobacteriaceae bacterium]|nr:ABC transporter permease [Cyclobacteriaceae bacterium]
MKKPIHPPRMARKLISWFGGNGAEDLLGDLDESFNKTLRQAQDGNVEASPARARRQYWRQVISLIFSSALRYRRKKASAHALSSSSPMSLAMLKNYAVTASRSLIRHRSYSLINIICLSVGMSVGLLALGALVDIKEVDDYHVNRDRLYRVITVDENGRDHASTSAPLAEKLRNEGTAFEEVIQLEGRFNPQVVTEDQLTVPLIGYYASPNFLNTFTFPLIEGDARMALARPFTMLITTETAQKLFPSNSFGNVIGRIVEVEGVGDFEVTGIVADYARSHFYFDALTSLSTLEALERTGQRKPSLSDWGPSTNFYTYLLLKEHANPDGISALLARMEEFAPYKEDKPVHYKLEALTDIPMNEHYNEIGRSWGSESLIVFFSLALLVLLPACFNYANISMARGMKRAKEIGLRKVSGGEQQHIFFQMILETAIVSLASLAAALPVYMIIKEEFVSMIVGGVRTFDLDITPALFGLFVLFALITGIVAGAFPALYFARLSPVETLRNAPGSGRLSRISVRKWLVVTQFALSTVFIMGVIIALKQYRYALNYDLGFQKENMLTVPLKGANVDLVRNELGNIPGVHGISFAASIPGNGAVFSTWAQLPGEEDSIPVAQLFVDRQYLEVMQMKLVAGTTFPEASASGETHMVVNETFLTQFELGDPSEAIGKVIVMDQKQTELRIAGVVKDFNYAPLHDKIEGFAFRYHPANFHMAMVRMASQDPAETIIQLEKAWKVVSQEKFEAEFLDDQLRSSLQGFLSMAKIFGFLGLVAITVSALGLLAIVISAAETRTREMGIRKVMGASPTQIASILSLGFFKLVGIGAVIAIPITYFMFDKVFLQMIYYRTQIETPEILFSLFLLFSMVAIVVSSQTLRVARINPVDTLRSE